MPLHVCGAYRHTTAVYARDATYGILPYMESVFIGVHAGIGELGAIAFLWVFIELLDPNAARTRRAHIAAFIGALSLWVSWIVGGYYYVVYYGSNVKPVIKEGPLPWAHLVVTETKEHVFLFLPFLAILVLGLIIAHRKELNGGRRIQSILVLSLLVFLIGMAMAGLGYTISSGFRSAIEANV